MEILLKRLEIKTWMEIVYKKVLVVELGEISRRQRQLLVLAFEPNTRYATTQHPLH